MVPHYHFYCDESGQFEEGLYYKNSLVFGLLVPDEHRETLAADYIRLKESYPSLRSLPVLHGMELQTNEEYKRFTEDLVKLTVASPIQTVSIRHEQDILKNVAGGVPETFYCNRYLYMIQALIDTVLFFHPPLWHPATDFTFRHNTRVFAVQGRAHLDELREQGYSPFQPRKNQEKWLVNVWDNAGFMIFLKRRLADFSPYHQTTGVRNVVKADMQTASRSEDVFSAWADALVGILRRRNPLEMAGLIADTLCIDAVYGREHQRYTDLVTMFLEKRYDDFLSETLSYLHRVTHAYYRDQLRNLVDQALDHVDINGPMIGDIAGLMESQVENSTGNWGHVLAITEKLIARLEAATNTPETSAALKTLRASRLSCLNHRGETREAEILAKTLVEDPARTVEDIRKKAEIINRLAVTGANRFDFIEPARQLVPYIQRLIASRSELSQIEGRDLNDPLIGRLASTAGQAFAFATPFNERHREAASFLLKTALMVADTPEDTLRQSVYLAHLYLDMDRFSHRFSLLDPSDPEVKQEIDGLVRDTMDYVAGQPLVSAFIRRPFADTPLSMAFVLAVFLKYEFQTGQALIPDSDAWVNRHLESAFGHCSNEHPFELIFGYLGQKAMAKGDFHTAGVYFENALNIPVRIKDAPPVIQAIHGQIIGLWARCLLQHGKQEEAHQKIRVLLHVMGRIADNPDNATILTRDGGGWFGSEIQTLEKALKQNGDVEASLSAFLERFTFNYR